MKYLIIGVPFLILAAAFPRVRRSPYSFPDGAEELAGPIKTTFNCGGLKYGYYADIDNGCKVFHVCNPVENDDGSQEVEHSSFICGNKTVFNQYTLTCTFQEDAVPCAQSKDFYYVNDKLGLEDALFLTDDDIVKAKQAIEKS